MSDGMGHIGQRLGNYRLIRRLGEGAFATVYLGEHVYLQTLAAIKVVQIELSQDTLQSFLAEAQTIARLRHPSIIGLLEFGLDRSTRTPFLAMEYAPNGSLRQRYPRGTRLPPAQIVSYVKQITSGLQYAHDERLIHRDIKPENLLLGEDGEVLLTDFNIAMIAQTQQYQKTQEVAGTPTYMAPEQLHGKPTFASDQYALGIVVYEWLCGSCPFRGSFMEVASQHIWVPPPPLHTTLPLIPPAFEQVVMTALAKTPQQRFATVQSFASALEQAYVAATSPLANHYPPDHFIPLSSPIRPDEAAHKPLTTPNLQQLATTVPPAQPGSPPSQHQRNRTINKIILSIIVALVLLSSSGLFYYLRVMQPTSQHTVATVTASANIDSNMRLYLTATSGSTDLNDTLDNTDPTAQWDDNQANCTFSDGAYHATASQQGTNPCLVEGTDYSDLSDFAYQVQMTITQGDEGGLIFRYTPINNNQSASYYLFGIKSDGHYSLSYQNTKNLLPLKQGTSSAIRSGLSNPNLLTVIAHGNTLFLYINQKYVTTVTDHNLSTGMIGVFAQNNNQVTDIAFHNAQVWKLTGKSLP